ncbi:MAG: class I tRNA ligase family protein, partial [Dehalococcoidia bacterium]
MFKPVDSRASFPEMEKRILRFWKERDVFRKSIEGRPEDKLYVFYEGPPTANARPGVHHVLSRAFKDLFPRYKTMRGYRVPR